jgi:UDP-glucose 4-epimerase
VLVGARDAGVRRVVYAASSSAYGDTPDLPKREDMVPNPLSPYALQKLIGEQYHQMFTRLYGLDTVSIRYFNVFGPRQDPSSPYSGVIALFVTRLLAGLPPLIIGDGEQTRDFTYIDNVVDGVLKAATAPDATGRVINVATGSRTSINQLAQAIQRVLGTNLPPQYAEARSGDVRDSLADIGLARRVLGYEPHISFEEGLRRTVDWYRAASV